MSLFRRNRSPRPLPGISLRDELRKLPRPDDRIEISLSEKAQSIVNMDAIWREAYPSLTPISTTRGTMTTFSIARRDALNLCDDFFERASPAAEGFGETAGDRAIARKFGFRIYDLLFPERS